MSFHREPEDFASSNKPDCGEKISDVLLCPLRAIFGKKVVITEIDPNARTFTGRAVTTPYTNSTVVKGTVIAASIILFPLTLIGAGAGSLALACSKSHKAMFNLQEDCDVSDDEIELVAEQPIDPSALTLYPQNSYGSYAVIKFLAQGGNGIVLEVRYNEMNYAMKINRPEKESSAHLQQEAELLTDLNMAQVPHIVRCVRHFDLKPFDLNMANSLGISLQPGQMHAMVMPLLSEDTHTVFIQKERLILSDDILHIGRLALETLAHLNLRGYVHRDLKPENIVYNPDTHEFCLCDFGAAIKKEGNAMIPYVHNVGTRHYRAPEMVVKIPYDERVDMWSLGITLFNLYTKKALVSLKDPSDEAIPFDYFHFLERYMGLPSTAFIEQIPESADGTRGPFFKGENGEYQIAKAPSQVHAGILRKLDVKRNICAPVKLWEASILEMADKLGEDPEDGQRLVDFLRLLLSYDRCTPQEALQHLEPPTGEQKVS